MKNFQMTTSGVMITLLFLSLSGCIPRQATQTVRPTVNESPWAARTVRSEATGQEYQYLHLGGPGESAPRLLLLHGGFFDQRMWLNMNDLGRQFEVFAMGMPSESPLYEGRVENYGDIAHDFLHALRIDDLVVVGQSAGGWVAVDLVSRHQDLNVRALVLISTSMFAITEEEVEQRIEVMTTASEMEPERLRATVEYAVGRAELDHAPGELQLEDIFYVRPYGYYDQLFGVALNQGDRRQATDQITCPVLAIHGTGDETIPFEAAQATPSLFSDATLVPMEGLDHAMTFSHGSQVSEVILEFVEERAIFAPVAEQPLATASRQSPAASP